MVVSSIQRRAAPGTSVRPVRVACGGQHSLVAVEVYTAATAVTHWELWGSGTNVRGALGTGVGQLPPVTAVGAAAAGRATGGAAAPPPAPPPRPSGRPAAGSLLPARRKAERCACACEVAALRSMRCSALAAGASHSLAVAHAPDSGYEAPGVLFAWGRNTYGACGVAAGRAGGDVVWEPLRAVFAARHGHGGDPAAAGGDGDGVVAVAAGQDHTVVVTASAHVWTCGRDGDGQCGRGAGSGPRDIGDAAALTSSASREAAYSSHARSGTARAWASLGAVAAPAAFVASRATAAGGWGKAAAAGNCHTVILGLDGRCYAFGSGRHGQTGSNLGAAGRDSTQLPEPVHVPCNSGAEIVQVCCGADHTLARASDGAMYAWGSNQFGQLGLHRRFDDGIANDTVGLGEEVLVPTRITHSTLLAHRRTARVAEDEEGDGAEVPDVLFVAAGDDFTFVLTAPQPPSPNPQIKA